MKKITISLLLFIFMFSFGYLHAQITSVPENLDETPVKVDLNGTWKFNDSYKGNLAAVNKPGSSWKNITVPGEWTMQGFSVEPGEKGTYFREIEIPKQWKNYDVFLRCDAVFSQAEVAVNGKKAGTFTGPMVAFDMEVTDLVKYGKSNNITVGVTAETMADTLMSGTQYAAHQMGGILRKIYLYAVPKVHIADLVVNTILDEKYHNANLQISGVLRNNSEENNAEVKVNLFDPEGTEIKLSNNIQKIDLKGKSEKEIELQFAVANPLKWDAEHPNLYRLELEINSEAGKELIVKNIGFRKIEVVGNQLFVNGNSVKLKGVNRHEVHPLRGRSLTPEQWEQDALMFKNGNVNYIRTSHYPPAEEFIEWCDKIGLYVELENPICWVGHGANSHWKTHDPKNPEFYPYFEQVSTANLSFFRNHPSILIWSMANESMWTENWSKLADFYTKADPTRPATFHDQGYGGFNNYGSTKMMVANIHYPGTHGADVAQDFRRPLLFGEFAHLNTYNRVEIVTDPGVRDVWGRGFKKMWEGMYKSRGCLGGAIWSGIDDVFYLPDGRTVGYGEWGPIDGWRREKPEYYHMKKSYSPVKIHNRHIEVPGKEGIQLQIENRFDFTNLNECEFAWKVDDENGIVDVNLTPHQSGIVIIKPKSSNLNGKILTVNVTSPQGIEVEACAIEIGNVKRDDFPYKKTSSGQLTVNEKSDFLYIEGENFKWTFDKNKGSLAGANANGEKVLSGGAELMMLDLTTGACLTEHSFDIPTHNATCEVLEIFETNIKASNDSVVVLVNLEYDYAKGSVKYLFNNEGELNVTYDFTSKVEMNPRQWGIVFTAPEKVNNLEWYRKGLWSWYPDNHIGRPNGIAVPFGDKAFFPEEFGQVPENDWCYDANQLGTNDFRATRENIYWASLTSATGTGVTVLSDGTQAFRSFVDGDKGISFLVAGYSTGGGDLFFSGHYKDERKKLQKGSPVKGTVRLQLVNEKQ
ncbi:MAG: glycoside hydrolase family 2 TIM barrel-domain containing protein [Bacteroidota bacterium]